jgi:hypothetical protein
MGVLPFYNFFTSDEDYRREVYELLSKPGLKWVKPLNANKLSVFSDSDMIWDNFDLETHIELMAYKNFKLVIYYEDRSQVEEYAPIFNYYEPLNGIEFSVKVVQERDPNNFMYS